MTRLAGESPRVARYIKLSPPGTDDVVVLCCEIAGEGPPVLLLPGLGDTVWVWRRLIPFLQKTNLVIAVEMRGHGRSASPKGPYTLGAMAEDLAALIERLGLGPAVLIGHGLGARAALLLAIERPGRAAALVLLGAGAEPPRGERAEGLAERMARAARRDMHAAFKARKSEGGLPRGMSARERAEYHRIFLGQNFEGYAASCAAELEAPDLSGRLGEVRCPALILAGEQDEARQADAARLGEGIPEGEAVVVRGAGHYVQLDQPDAFHLLLQEFLKKHNLMRIK